MGTNVIPLRKSRLKEVIKHWKSKYGGAGLAGAVLDLSLALDRRNAGESTVDSGRPYVEVFACDRELGGAEYYMIKVHCWAFVVDEWMFYSPRCAGIQQLLKHGPNERVRIPWNKIRAKPRGWAIKEDGAWYGELDTESKYWLAIEEMILADVNTRSEPAISALAKLRPTGRRGALISKQIKDRNLRELTQLVEIWARARRSQ